MMISVFTASHDTKFLNDCYISLQNQTTDQWDWVVVLNHGASYENNDPRVKIFHTEEEGGVGLYKNLACSLSEGDILVELDHDDMLLPNALEKVQKAFDENENVVFVYSDTIQIMEDGSKDELRYSADFGWVYGENEDGVYPITFQPHPQNVAHIWYAPNHIRAFRKSAYNLVGGYDTNLMVLDDQDLMCKLYQVGEFFKLNQPVYKQRRHDKNTQSEASINAHIQTETVKMANFYIEPMMVRWCERNNLMALDLGSAHNKPDGYVGVDLIDAPGVDIVGNFLELDLPEGSVGLIRAYDFMEHVADKVAFIGKAYYLLADGGMLLSMTPSTDGRGAFQDPTHVAFYNENSFWYYTKAETAKYIGTPVRFQASSVETFFPSPWHQQHEISYVRANLIAIKNEERNYGGRLEI